jgi:hypothetical protein
MTAEPSDNPKPLCPRHYTVMVLNKNMPADTVAVTSVTIHTHYCECPLEHCNQGYSPELGYFTFQKSHDHWAGTNSPSVTMSANSTQVLCSDERKNAMFLEAFDPKANLYHFRCPQINCDKMLKVPADGPPVYWVAEGFFDRGG